MWYQRIDEGIRVSLYIQPGAKQTEIYGLYDNSLKIRLNAPPTDGRANEALLKFIALLCDVPVSQVLLQRGDKSRHKLIFISGSRIDPTSLLESIT